MASSNDDVIIVIKSIDSKADKAVSRRMSFSLGKCSYHSGLDVTTKLLIVGEITNYFNNS